MPTERARFPNGVSIVMREMRPSEGGGYVVEVIRKGSVIRSRRDGLRERAKGVYDAWCGSERKGLSRE